MHNAVLGASNTPASATMQPANLVDGTSLGSVASRPPTLAPRGIGKWGDSHRADSRERPAPNTSLNLTRHSGPLVGQGRRVLGCLVGHRAVSGRLARTLGVAEYRRQYEQEWRPTEQDRKAAELAERYHRETEAYDRTVCTGPVLHGAVMPIDHRELALVNGNARRVLAQIMAEAAAAGIRAEDMRRAIGRHA